MSAAPNLEILVEELSAEAALRAILPKIVPGLDFEIRVFRGKPDLLKKLPMRLAGYAAWSGAADLRIVALVDRDDDDCRKLRQRLDDIATDADLLPRGAGRDVLNCIAVEELEAWFLGDIVAVAAAFPRVPASASAKSGLRDPDAIRGGTAEVFERLLQQHGYQKAGLAKVSAAAAVSRHMDVERNTSRSFQVFRDGLREFSKVGTV